MHDQHTLPGWPEEPPYEPALRDQPQVVHHHHYPAPPPARSGPDVRTVLAWTAVGGVSVAALLAVALAAVGIGLAAVALGILALVLRGIWRDLRKR